MSQRILHICRGIIALTALLCLSSGAHAHTIFDGDGQAKTRHTVFITEPQLWYNVGQHFGCENLSLGGEVEITNNFGSTDGAKVRPCLGVKWDF